MKPEVSTCDRPRFVGKKPHIYTAGMRLYEAEMRPRDIHTYICSLLDTGLQGLIGRREKISEITYYARKIAVHIYTFFVQCILCILQLILLDGQLFPSPNILNWIRAHNLSRVMTDSNGRKTDAFLG